MQIDSTAQRWRDLFLEAVAPWKDLPNFMSGGADSATILAAQLALGSRPQIFTLALGRGNSSDAKVAQSMAQAFGLSFHLVLVPRQEAVLIEDIRDILQVLGTTRKTAVQCGQCMKHLSMAASRAGYQEALIGTGGIVEDCRACAVILGTEGEEAARAYRRSSLFDSRGNTMNGTRAMFDAARHWGIEMREPYSQQPFADFALSLDMAEINYPFQKGIAFRAFPEFWGRGAWRRRNKSMQVCAGIRAWHDTLLHTPWNKRGKKAIIAVYNDISKGA